MKKITIVLDSHDGHISHVFTDDQNLVVEVVDIDPEAANPVWGPYDPGVTVLVPAVDAAVSEYIQAHVPASQHEQAQAEDVLERFSWLKSIELWPSLVEQPEGRVCCVSVASDPCRLFLAAVLQRETDTWVASLLLDGVHKIGPAFSTPDEAQRYAEREIRTSLRASGLFATSFAFGSMNDDPLSEVAALLLIFLDEEMQIALLSHYETAWVVVCVSQDGTLFEDYVFVKDQNGFFSRHLPIDCWDVQSQELASSSDREEIR